MLEEHISEQRKQLLKFQEQFRIENMDIQQLKENLLSEAGSPRVSRHFLVPIWGSFDGSMESAVSPTSGDEDT
jgi:hypothetical protein